MTKGTMVRTVMLAVVLLNWILRQTGNPIIEVDEGSVASFIQMAIEIAAVAVAWWKNNSFSENAIKADNYLRTLNEQSEGGK